MTIVKQNIVLISICILLYGLSGCNDSNSNSTQVPTAGIATYQEIILDDFLDTPIRILDNEEDLNLLYTDLNISKNSDIEPDFTTDRVIYIQRKGSIVEWNNEEIEYKAVEVNVKEEELGIRVLTRITSVQKKSARIIVIKNVAKEKFFFTQSQLLIEDDLTCYSDQNKLYNRDLNITTSIGSYPISLEHFISADRSSFPDEDILSDYFLEYNTSLPTQEIDFETKYIFTPGSFTDNSQIHYDNASLKEVYVKNSKECSGSATSDWIPDKFQIDVMAFEINGTRSDCVEYNTSVEKNISLYSLSKEIATTNIYGIYNSIELSVKSCTGYTSTPPMEEVKWNEVLYVEAEN